MYVYNKPDELTHSGVSLQGLHNTERLRKEVIKLFSISIMIVSPSSFVS